MSNTCVLTHKWFTYNFWNLLPKIKHTEQWLVIHFVATMGTTCWYINFILVYQCSYVEGSNCTPIYGPKFFKFALLHAHIWAYILAITLPFFSQFCKLEHLWHHDNHIYQSNTLNNVHDGTIIEATSLAKICSDCHAGGRVSDTQIGPQNPFKSWPIWWKF